MPLRPPTAASLAMKRSALAAVSSPMASARTATVTVWVPALPPIEATIGISTASATIFSMAPSNWPITREAITAVTRFTVSHTPRRRAVRTVVGVHVVDADAAHLQQVLLGLLVDHVDHVVDHDHAEQPAARRRPPGRTPGSCRGTGGRLRPGRRSPAPRGCRDRRCRGSAPAACCAACGRAAPSRAAGRPDRRRRGRRRRRAGRRLAAIVDHLADRPALRHLDQRALHQAAGAVLGIGERASRSRRAPRPAARPGPRGAPASGRSSSRLAASSVSSSRAAAAMSLLSSWSRTSSSTSSSSSVRASGSRSRLRMPTSLSRSGSATLLEHRGLAGGAQVGEQRPHVLGLDLRRARSRRAGPAPAALRRGRRGSPLIPAPPRAAGPRPRERRHVEDAARGDRRGEHMRRQRRAEQHRPDMQAVGGGLQQVEGDVGGIERRADHQVGRVLQPRARKDVVADLGVERGVAMHLAVDLEAGARWCSSFTAAAILRAEG